MMARSYAHGDIGDKGLTASWPTRCTDFADEEEVVRTYYGEMMELVKCVRRGARLHF